MSEDRPRCTYRQVGTCLSRVSVTLSRWHEGCSEIRRGTAKRDRKRQTPKGGRRLATHLPFSEIPVWWRRAVLPHPPFTWPKYRFRSGPPQILISKFRGAAANFEVDFDCQNASVLPQDRAYRRRTPTRDIPPLNWTRPPPQTRLTRGRTAVLAQAIALRSPATDRAHLPALAPITSSAGGRRMTQLL